MALWLRAAVIAATRGGDSKAPKQPPQSTEPEFKNLDKAQQDMAALSSAMPHVAVRALNKAMTGTKTDMVKIVRQTHNYKAGALRKRLKVSRATRAKIKGHVESKGRAVHLTDIAGTRQTKKGVTVNVKKDSGRQLIPRAFKAISRKSGKEIVLRRPSTEDYGGYDELYGRYGPPGSGGTVGKRGQKARLMWFPAPHPEYVYNAPDTWARVKDAAAERIDTNIEREMDAEIRKMEGKW